VNDLDIIKKIYKLNPSLGVKLIFLSIVSAIFEILQIWFIGEYLRKLVINDIHIMEWADIVNDSKFQIDTITLLIVTIITCSLKIKYLKDQSRLMSYIGAELTEKIHNYLIHEEYEDQLKKNTNDYISIISKKVMDVVRYSVMPLYVIPSNLVGALSVAAYLTYVSHGIMIIFFIGIIIFYRINYRYSKKNINEISEKIASSEFRIAIITRETFDGIRDIILSNGYKNRHNLLMKHVNILWEMTSRIMVLANYPRYILELIVIFLLCLVGIYATTLDTSGLIVIIATFGLGVMRIVASLHQGYAYYSTYKGNIDNLNLVMNLYKNNKKNNINSNLIYRFQNELKINNGEYWYDNNNIKAIENVNIRIKKGEKVGIRGISGGGKSTFIDILSGILMLKKGLFLVDGVVLNKMNLQGLRENISYVSQRIFLRDDTIKNNIVDEDQVADFDELKFNEIIKICNLEDLIKQSNDQENFRVGENGSLLSGGQRQRICIARALYSLKEILIMDEATSALDEKTEEVIISNIIKKYKDLTIIMVSHRVKCLEFCSVNYEINNGKISKL
jgi:ABC-type multidrug transport system fused ATPase/permease subunit